MPPKAKASMSTLGSTHTAQHLKRLHPFLQNRQFRVLKKDEVKSVEVLKELFNETDEAKLWMVDAVYKLQQCDTKTRETSTSPDSNDSASTSTDSNQPK